MKRATPQPIVKGFSAESVLSRIMASTGIRSQSELARALGIGRQAVTDAKKRSHIPADWYLFLCRKYGLNPQWLESGMGPMYVAGNSDAPAALGSGTPGAHPEEFSYVPKVRARLSAGGGSLVVEEAIDSYYAFRHAWLKRKGQISQMRLMRVSGDSMEPTLRDEDVVLIDLSQTEVYTGKIYAVGIDEEIVVKRLDKKPGKLVLVSDNRQFYPPLEVTLHEGSNVRLLGRVIWMGREVL
ncbi:putative HTH-type transcriptional regulator [Fundidesulfovibrio magnetotacticus]|uniref:Putative HTH-type transcriptional regulator n=1 Tax=Fundidesulfovibrio magnetotacticus TaxID=2730080 RepID=A0A6V8M0L8_9BACT|nr:S24 family peptidase [Fundidesulfovibrio magnetotacticus]GFK94015.1 putative HTH-type transcriptional regulator [Fundidesulfovibrio magnetotacticus]